MCLYRELFSEKHAYIIQLVTLITALPAVLLAVLYAYIAAVITVSCGQGRGNRGVRGQMPPPPEIYLGVKRGILTPRFFWKEIFSGTDPPTLLLRLHPNYVIV